MIDLIKKYKVLSIILLVVLLLDLTIAALAIIPANKDITSPGGLNEVKSVIEANTDTNLKGSFNTIYVYSMERVSLLQALVADIADYNEVVYSSDTIVLTDEERIKSGKIQKAQSIEASLICAYDAAKSDSINLDYSFIGFIVYMTRVDHDVFEIGDIITKINDVDTSNIEKLAEELNNLKLGDVITYKRNDNVSTYVVNVDFKTNNQMFYCYSKYKINTETASPSYTLHESNTLGPSGGLMQTLSVYSQITGKDLTCGKKIAGTGTISTSGKVGIIGGISQKIVTAIYNKTDLFLCPAENYEEALNTYNKTPGHENMILVKVETFLEAVNALGEHYENK